MAHRHDNEIEERDDASGHQKGIQINLIVNSSDSQSRRHPHLAIINRHGFNSRDGNQFSERDREIDSQMIEWFHSEDRGRASPMAGLNGACEREGFGGMIDD